MTVHAVDSADNVGAASRTIYVGNTAPIAPTDMTVAGGPGWRLTNSFRVAWCNPAQRHAPIAGARYRICPVTNGPTDLAGCVSGRRSGRNIRQIRDVKVASELVRRSHRRNRLRSGDFCGFLRRPEGP